MAIDGQVHLGGGSTLDLPVPGATPNSATQQGGDLLFEPGGGTIQTHSGTSPGDPDSTYSLLDDSGMFSNGGTGTLINFGAFQKIGGTGVSVIEATLLRSDTVTVASGTLRFADVDYRLYSANTLGSGAWNVLNGSTLEFSQANAAGGAIIRQNNARILLSGASATIADSSGNDILRDFLADNRGFLTVQNGANFITASSGFTNNAGNVIIGPNSTFTVGGSHDYVNAARTTLTSSTSTLVVAPGQSFSNNHFAARLSGLGTIQGSLVNSAGVVEPGLPGQAGVLTVSGDYTEGSTSTLSIQLGGPTAGTDFSQLAVLGTSFLQGTLDISLMNGFTPSLGDEFVILTSAAGLSGSFIDNIIQEGPFTFEVLYEPTQVVLSTINVVPEPTMLLLLASGIAGAAVAQRRNRRV